MTKIVNLMEEAEKRTFATLVEVHEWLDTFPPGTPLDPFQALIDGTWYSFWYVEHQYGWTGTPNTVIPKRKN